MLKPPSYSVAINPFPGKGELVILFGGHAQTDPLHQVGSQILDYHLVHSVSSGKGSFRCMGNEYELKKGDHFFIFPGELVSYTSDAEDPWSYKWIAFKGTHPDQFLSLMGISPHKPIVHTGNNRRAPALFSRIENVLREASPSCDMQAGGYLRILLGEYAMEHMPAAAQEKAISPQQQQMQQAIRWLTLQYTQPISIEQMANDLGYHRTYLSKIFKQFTGMAPTYFLLKLRMDRAKLLLQEQLTIEQVASSVGFTDALYFSKQFKKWSGLSPSEFRSQGSLNAYDCTK
ncbi:AraC family transcriptional regulator [Paenibacillus eucommiae]|uniref:AraC-like DNA-binding protein n=1 Tax=Paenibacillus eucommiae TaxID=1355755 RepID=A0ABS4IP34_9BACL|nr:AraC family transcriptional regulator [Paenibacillus eucommiae]MBP1989312.1 AraC-like DNA-binding protein [Paenibacillus eucommiae]